MWKTVKIEDICQIGDGNHSSNYPKASEMVQQGVPFLRAGNIQSGTVFNKDLKFITPEKHLVLKKGHLKKGDVLVTNRGEIGKTAIVPKIFDGANLNSQIAWLRPDERLLSAFLYHVLNAPSARASFKSKQTGAALQQLTIRQIKQLEIPLPPIAEQQRIVAKLDAAFAEIDRAIKLVQAKQANAEKLKASLLDVSLTSDDALWKTVKLGDLYDVGSSKRVLKADWKDEGVPFYRGREITTLSANGFVDNDLFITEQHYEALLEKSGVPKADDIMITAIGTIGNTYIVQPSQKFYFKDASVLWLRKKTDVSSKYVQYWLKSDEFFSQLDKGNGATVDTLTIKKLASVVLPLPPFAEQQRIVAKLDAAFTEIETVFSTAKLAIDNYTALKSSLLTRELNPSEAA